MRTAAAVGDELGGAATVLGRTLKKCCAGSAGGDGDFNEKVQWRSYCTDCATKVQTGVPGRGTIC